MIALIAQATSVLKRATKCIHCGNSRSPSLVPVGEVMTDHNHHTEPPSEAELKVKALESLLVEKGLVDPAALDALIDTYENRVGPKNGAQVVARPGLNRNSKTGCLRMPQRRLGLLDLPAGRGST